MIILELNVYARKAFIRQVILGYFILQTMEVQILNISRQHLLLMLVKLKNEKYKLFVSKWNLSALNISISLPV